MTTTAVDRTWSVSDTVKVLYERRGLLYELAKQDLTDHYVGHAFGIAWAIAVPMIRMSIYVVLFAVIFKVRLGDALDVPFNYPTYILCGLVPWLATSEAMNRGANAVIGQANLVKEVIFSLEVLPAKAVLTSVASSFISFSIFFAYVLFEHGHLLWSYALLPVVIILQIIFLMGIAMMFSAITPFFRDFGSMVGLSGTMLLYMAPIVYLADWVPSKLLPLIYLNPFTYMIWTFQDVLFFGKFQHPIAWVVFPLLSVGSFILGASMFRRLKPMFGNFL